MPNPGSLNTQGMRGTGSCAFPTEQTLARIDRSAIHRAVRTFPRAQVTTDAARVCTNAKKRKPRQKREESPERTESPAERAIEEDG